MHVFRTVYSLSSISALICEVPALCCCFPPNLILGHYNLLGKHHVHLHEKLEVDRSPKQKAAVSKPPLYYTDIAAPVNAPLYGQQEAHSRTPLFHSPLRQRSTSSCWSDVARQFNHRSYLTLSRSHNFFDEQMLACLILYQLGSKSIKGTFRFLAHIVVESMT